MIYEESPAPPGPRFESLCAHQLNQLLSEGERDLVSSGGNQRSNSSSGPTARAPGPDLNAIALRGALCRFRMRQGRVELFERPVYFAAGDHQGWTDTDNVVVGVLAQDAAPTQGVAVAPGAARLRV